MTTEKRIPLIKPYIQFEDIKTEFHDIFDSGIFTKGDHVRAFTKELADYLDAKHVFLTTSATTALWVCLKLLNICTNDEVIVSDFSFPASANVIEDLGAKPVFADINPDTYNMCPKDLEQKITPRTKAVMFVDALGNPSGLHEIKALCTEHNIPLIEDAACAIGSLENNKKCGAIADLTCFSFHPRKLMCTGEGGAITTHNDEWAKWLDVKLNHGANGMQGIALDFIDFGYNFRLPELQAAMGRKQIPRLDAIIKARQKTAAQYSLALSPLGFKPQQVNKNALHNVQSLVFTVPEHINRDRLHLALKEKNIETSIGTYAMSIGDYYMKKYNTPQKNSAALYHKTITLPCYDDVPTDYVIDKIKSLI